MMAWKRDAQFLGDDEGAGGESVWQLRTALRICVATSVLNLSCATATAQVPLGGGKWGRGLGLCSIHYNHT